jgi:hypothetical protein
MRTLMGVAVSGAAHGGGSAAGRVVHPVLAQGDGHPLVPPFRKVIKSHRVRGLLLPTTDF